MKAIANYFEIHLVHIMIILLIIGLIPIVYEEVRKYQAERNPDSLEYLFKKYKLDSLQDAWKALNNPRTPTEDKKKIAELIEFFNKINEH